VGTQRVRHSLGTQYANSSFSVGAFCSLYVVLLALPLCVLLLALRSGRSLFVLLLALRSASRSAKHGVSIKIAYYWWVLCRTHFRTRNEPSGLVVEVPRVQQLSVQISWN
jgi:hypothetical protein